MPITQIPFSVVVGATGTGGGAAAAAGGAGARSAAPPPPASAATALGDLDAYPILTEEVGYPPSPLATPSGSGGVPGSAPISSMALKAVSDVLGWKPKAGDVKGFLGALTQSFTLTNVEGHVESTWTPRTYAVQTDLAGGITGAQASIYNRASEAVNQATPLLNGLYALDTEADPADIGSLKAIINSQLTELVGELGLAGGPRVTRVNQIFTLLLGTGIPPAGFVPPPAYVIPAATGLAYPDPDVVAGQLGQIRDLMGLWSVVIANTALPPKTLLINTVEEEQNVTNYRILVDYLTSLQTSWATSQQFFGLNSANPFFGTQLVLLSRQFSVVSDAVDEVRFTMDSVFITPAERQTMKIVFANPAVQPMFVEDLLSWVQRFATEEGPRLITDGGKFAVGNSVGPVVKQLLALVIGAAQPKNRNALPRGYNTARVQRAWKDLQSQLLELQQFCTPIAYTMPPRE
jgi:hypothetical protein